MAKTRPRFQTESIIKTWPIVRLGELGTMVRGNGIKRSITEIWADSMEMLTPKSQDAQENNE